MRSLRARAGALLAATVAAAVAMVGCGGPRCNGQSSSDVSAGAPNIDSFFVLDQQIPGDPWTVLLGVDFTDADGDLGAGQAEYYLNSSNTPSVQGLDDAFRQSGVALSETVGSIWMALRFSDNIHDNSKVRLGLQLLDAKGNRSNCYTLELKFDVSPVATRHINTSGGVLAMRRVRCGGPG